MPKSFHVSRIDGLRIFVLILVVTGCATATARVPPRRATSLVISPTQRILVAGFVADTESPVDVNGQTVRLLRSELRRQGAFDVIQADPATLTSEAVFRDIAYWRIVGEEYGEPLIVTGSVRLGSASPRITQRGGGGRAGIYAIEYGLFLEADVVLIDGATGGVLAAARLPRQVRYGSGRHASPSLMYLAMMHSLMPDLVRGVLGQRSDAQR